jgi:hypothetical protein
MISPNKITLDFLADYLKDHHETVRLKKFLYAVCTDTWEQDTTYLESIAFLFLLEGMIKKCDSLSDLHALLQARLSKLNKASRYIEVVRTLYLAIGQLYPEFESKHSSRKPPENSSLSSLTQSFKSVDLGHPSVSLPKITIDYGESVSTEAILDPTSVEVGDDRSYKIVNKVHDPFLLRESVMAICNPLRAKILLMTVLDPEFVFKPNMPTSLKEHTLDELLVATIESEDFSSFERKISSALNNLDDFEEYGKTATGLLECLLRVYSQR